MKNILLTFALCFAQFAILNAQSLSEEWYSNRSEYTGTVIGQYNKSIYYMTYKSKSPNLMEYLGELVINEEGEALSIKNGWGIEKLPSYLHFNYCAGKYIPTNKNFEYYIGEWKDNFKDGKGFFIRYNGKIIAGEWKNGYLKRKTVRKLTEEEREYVNNMKNMIDEAKILK